MRGDATFTLDVDFGEARGGACERYFEEQLACFDRYLPDERRAAARRGAGEDLRHGRRQRPQDGAAGKLDHGGRWRDEQEWPLARAVPTTFHLRGDGSLSREAPANDEPRRFTYDPRGSGADDRRQLLRRRRASAGRARGWSRCGCGC